MREGDPIEQKQNAREEKSFGEKIEAEQAGPDIRDSEDDETGYAQPKDAQLEKAEARAEGEIEWSRRKKFSGRLRKKRRRRN